MQMYYGYPIRKNLGYHKNTKDAVLAIFYHMILGPSYETVDADFFFFFFIQITPYKASEATVV